MGTYSRLVGLEESSRLPTSFDNPISTPVMPSGSRSRKIYTEIPAVKIGDASLASYYSERIGGWTPIIQRGVPYWNLWLNDA